MEKQLDEYSLKKHDLAELKYLCKTLYRNAYFLYEDSVKSGINNPMSESHLQFNELIDYAIDFMVIYKLKHHNDNYLISEIEYYIDNTFSIFGNEIIELNDFTHWDKFSSKIMLRLSNENTNS